MYNSKNIIMIQTQDHCNVLPRHDSSQNNVFLSLWREFFLTLKYVSYKVHKPQLGFADISFIFNFQYLCHSMYSVFLLMRPDLFSYLQISPLQSFLTLLPKFPGKKFYLVSAVNLQSCKHNILHNAPFIMLILQNMYLYTKQAVLVW